MRAPQLGHTKGKKRGKQSPSPVYGAKLLTIGAAMPKPRLSRAIGLHGPNQPVPSRPIHYKPPKTAQFEDGTYGAPCTLHLHHKGAKWDNGIKVGGEGPVVTKRWVVVQERPQVKRG